MYELSNDNNNKPSANIAALQSQLTKEALEQGLGYKTANLTILTNLVARHQDGAANNAFGPYRVKIPTYIGIPYLVIHRLLNSVGFDLNQHWCALINKHYPTQQAKKNCLSSQQFSESFLADCAELRQGILDAFQKLITTPNIIEQNNVVPDEIRQAVNLLLQDLSKQQQRLMVRSTGREDTDTMANAGGNESVANVEANWTSLLNAASEVVASYFCEKSLKQRLRGSDKSIFDALAFTPVLLQHMIGEQDVQHSLPKCGVMFTEAPESAAENHDDDERHTSGLTIIHSTYGHNEGTVNAIVPVDSYHIDSDLHIYPIIRPKTYRLKPGQQSGELTMTENNRAQANAPALNRNALHTLKRFADALEKQYQRPMDVEFVVDEDSNIIYIVQARPIVHSQLQQPASYITPSEWLSATSHWRGETIVAASRALRIADSNEIIVTNTIAEAFNLYESHPNPADIQGVIIGENAPSTSHYANTLLAEGKIVFYIKDLNAVKHALGEPGGRMLLSPQQGMLVALDPSDAANVDDLLAAELAELGYASYPAPPIMSLVPDFLPKQPLSRDNLKRVYPALQEQAVWDQFEKNAMKVPTSSLFENLISAQGEQLQLTLATILYQLKKTLAHHSQDLDLDVDQQRQIIALENTALSLVLRIKSNGNRQNDSPHFSLKLLPIHFFRVLIYGQPSPGEVVSGYSLATLTRQGLAIDAKMIRSLRSKQISLKNTYTLPLLRLADLALSERVANDYIDFVISLDKTWGSDRLLRDFAQIIHQMTSLNVQMAWLNCVFPNLTTVASKSSGKRISDRLKSAKESASLMWRTTRLNVTTRTKLQPAAFLPAATVEMRCQHYLDNFHGQTDLLTSIHGKRRLLNNFNAQLFVFPNQFEASWRVLTQTLLPYFMRDQFTDDLQQTGETAKLALLASMYLLVDRFDLALKSLSSAAEYPLEKKLSRVQAMLQAYLSLARKWAEFHEIFNASDNQPYFGYRGTNKIDDIRCILDEAEKVIIRTDLTEKDLRPSDGFNVLLFESRSGTRVRNETAAVLPKTLEDSFTLIHHELINLISLLNINANIPHPVLPDILQEAVELFDKILHQRPIIDIDGSTVTLHFNKSYGAHGAHYQLSRAAGASGYLFNVRISGADDLDRWENVTRFMIALRVNGFYDVTAISAPEEYGVECSIAIDENDDFTALLKTFDTVCFEIYGSGGYLMHAEAYVQKQFSQGKVSLSPLRSKEMLLFYEKTVGVKYASGGNAFWGEFGSLPQNDPDFVEQFLSRNYRELDTNTVLGIVDSLMKNGRGERLAVKCVNKDIRPNRIVSPRAARMMIKLLEKNNVAFASEANIKKMMTSLNFANESRYCDAQHYIASGYSDEKIEKIFAEDYKSQQESIKHITKVIQELDSRGLHQPIIISGLETLTQSPYAPIRKVGIYILNSLVSDPPTQDETKLLDYYQQQVNQATTVKHPRSP